MDNKERNLQYAEPKISMLDAAKRTPVSVTRDTPLIDAITTMIVNDFSQLPVMQGVRTVQGMISWKSIGKRYGCHCRHVQDCMEGAEEIAILDSETPFIHAVKVISIKEFILVRGSDNQIVGLVTATDITEQFGFLSEPYFLIGAIEQYLRDLIGQRVPQEIIDASLCSNGDTQRTFDVSAMSFGDYICLLSKENIWNVMRPKLSKKVFLKRLDDVRMIRNYVMHFRGAPIADKEIQILRNFLGALKNVSSVNLTKGNRKTE